MIRTARQLVTLAGLRCGGCGSLWLAAALIKGLGFGGIKGAACGWIGGKLQASSQFVRVYHDSNFRFVMLVLALGIQRNFLQASKIGADKKQLQPHFLANSSTPPSC